MHNNIQSPNNHCFDIIKWIIDTNINLNYTTNNSRPFEKGITNLQKIEVTYYYYTHNKDSELNFSTSAFPKSSTKFDSYGPYQAVSIF